MDNRKFEYDEIKLKLIKKSLEKAADEVKVPVERRKGDDGILNFVNFVCFTLWFVLLMIIVLLSGNKGGIKYQMQFFDGGEMEYMLFAFFLTLICLCVCSVTIVLNFTRNRRRRDRIKKPLIVYEAISFIIGITLIFVISGRSA